MGGEARLDVGLGLTPVPKRGGERELWEGGEVGGWELWIAGEEGGDEATYGASGSGGAGKGEGEGEGEKVAEEEEDDDDDDGPLLAFQPGWNELSLVMRDPGVLKFVKYLSARAPGSRWDLGGEWEVAQVEEEEEEEGGAE